jgi:hypothetical protein
VDTVAPDERRGDATFDWTIGDRTFAAAGHLFTPSEMQKVIRDSGLRVVQRVAIDYEKGSVSTSVLRGQLVYQLADSRQT